MKRPLCKPCIALSGRPNDRPRMHRIYVRDNHQGTAGFYPTGWICNWGHVIVDRHPVVLMPQERMGIAARRANRRRAKRKPRIFI